MRVKEAPASALRAVFGGIGSLLGVTDKVRAKPAAPEATVSTETAPPETTTPETVAPVAAATETAPATEVAAPEAETPEAAVAEVDVVEVDVIEVDVIEVAAPEAEAPEPVVVEPVVTETAAPETAVAEDAAALPLANYDDLSIASLRARLRNLSADQLGTLIDYEKGHAARADVITMFERRIVKLAEA